MSDFTRQQLCAALSISESTVRRLEARGLPYTPVGARTKRYNLEEVKRWLRSSRAGNRETYAELSGDMKSATQEFVIAARRMKLRVTPSA